MSSIINKGLALLAAVGLGSAGFMLAAIPAHATNTDPNADHKVTLCHRTGSAAGGELKNGYNEITVDIASSGLVKGGHTNHEQVGNGPGPDIIPAYEAFAKVKGQWEAFSYPGKGLDWVFEDGTTGAEFLANGCALNQSYEDQPTVVSVDFINPTCTVDAAIITDYDNSQAVAKVEGTVAPGETVTVTFTAKNGYYIKGTSVFTHTFSEVPEGCNPNTDTDVRADVRFTNPTCQSPKASVETLDVTGVKYEVFGTAAEGHTVKVVASAKDGYNLVGQSTWTHVFGFPVGCGGSTPPSKHHHHNQPTSPNQPNQPNQPSSEVSPAVPTSAELPHTGAAADTMALGAGALGLISLGALLLRVSRRPEGLLG